MLNWLRPSRRKMNEFFRSIDADFDCSLADVFARQHELERMKRSIAISEYVQPTADGFGFLFELFGKTFCQQHAASLKQIGQAIGSAIIAFDCAADWEADQRRRRFNPLAERTAVSSALSFAATKLSEAGWVCVDCFGDRSRCAAVLSANVRSLRRRVSLPKPRQMEMARTIWKGAAARRGDCDIACCCDANFCGCDFNGCDCHNCDASGADCANSATCCDPAYCGNNCDMTQSQKKREKNAESQPAESSKFAALIGKVGVAQGNLNPSGVILVDGNEVPARSPGLFIHNGEPVRVSATNSFGVTVVPLHQATPTDEQTE